MYLEEGRGFVFKFSFSFRRDPWTLYFKLKIMLDIKKIEAAINMISAEKKIPKEKLIDIIESAIRTAYKKDYGYKDEKVNVHLNLEA
jgi:hypothetical protein